MSFLPMIFAGKKSAEFVFSRDGVFCQDLGISGAKDKQVCIQRDVFELQIVGYYSVSVFE